MSELKLDERFHNLPAVLGVTENQLSKTIALQFGAVEALSKLIERAETETALGRMVALIQEVRKLIWVSESDPACPEKVKEGRSGSAPLSTIGSLYNAIYWNTGTPAVILAGHLVKKMETGWPGANFTERALAALLALQEELREVVQDHRGYFKTLFAPAA